MATSEHHAHKNSVSHTIDPEKHASNFKGYTIDELRYQLMVNRLKTEITTDKLMMLVSPKAQRNCNALSGYVSGFSTFFRYFDIAVLAYTIFHKFGSVIRVFSSSKKR